MKSTVKGPCKSSCVENLPVKSSGCHGVASTIFKNRLLVFSMVFVVAITFAVTDGQHFKLENIQKMIYLLVIAQRIAPILTSAITIIRSTESPLARSDDKLARWAGARKTPRGRG